MDLKAYEKRRVRELYRRITRNLNRRRRYAERKGRSFTPDQGPFGNVSIAIIYWTLWTGSISGI